MKINAYTNVEDAVWGAVDTRIDTDFPDVRNLSVIENNGQVSFGDCTGGFTSLIMYCSVYEAWCPYTTRERHGPTQCPN